jgi:hypothetical protein
MSISICEETTTLITVYLQLVHHFLEGTDRYTILVLLVLVLSYCSTPLCYGLAFEVN